MKRITSKLLFKVIVAAVMATTLLLGTVFVLGTPPERGTARYIFAEFGRILINLDGQDITEALAETHGREPLLYVAAGTTYLPMRALAEMLGYEVDFCPETFTAYLTRPEPGYHGLTVFWGRGAGGTRVHISESCRSFNLIPIRGTLEQASEAGRFGWCLTCSSGLEELFPIEHLRELFTE